MDKKGKVSGDISTRVRVRTPPPAPFLVPVNWFLVTFFLLVTFLHLTIELTIMEGVRNDEFFKLCSDFIHQLIKHPDARAKMLF